jgi:hypothetical protein
MYIRLFDIAVQTESVECRTDVGRRLAVERLVLPLGGTFVAEEEIRQVRVLGRFAMPGADIARICVNGKRESERRLKLRRAAVGSMFPARSRARAPSPTSFAATGCACPSSSASDVGERCPLLLRASESSSLSQSELHAG